MLFTSGSEGTPKGVVLSHRNLLANRHQLATVIDVNPKDIVLNALPVFHSFGLTGGLLLPLFAGVRTFLYPSPLHYRTVPELAYGINATILFGTDTFLAGYARVADNYDFYSVRYVFAGAERVKPETRRVWFEKFGIRILEGYGATETAPAIAVNTPMHFKAGTVGRFLPGIEHRLEKVPGVEASGRLSVSGPNVMLGYLRAENPGVLQPPPDGWYDTGDIVDIDAEGFVTIKGRVKRFAKIAGEMVPLGGVEELVGKAYPKSAHAVVALPDPKKGERLVLLTRTRRCAARAADDDGARDGPAGDLRAAVIVHVKSIPLLGTGKIDYVGGGPALFAIGQRSPQLRAGRPVGPQLWAVFGRPISRRPGMEHAYRPPGDSMESFVRDVLFAFSSLRRQPAFAITAVLTIALGIGATSAIFSVVNAVLLRPLPYNDAARLGTVWSDLRNRNVMDFPLPPGDFFDMRNDADAVRRLRRASTRSVRPSAATARAIRNRCRAARSRPTSSACSAIAFTSAATSSRTTARRSRRRPRGRRAAAARARSRHRPLPNIAIISYEFWQRRYGGNESIVGKSIEFGNGRAEIVGVLAPGFELLFPPGTNVDPRPDILVANRVNFETGSRNNVLLRVVAKLKPGVIVRTGAVGARSALRRSAQALSDQADLEHEPAHRADARRPRRRRAAAAGRVDGRGGVRAADRVRERRQPAAGARLGARA